jgi:guanosine-3',5'-bis(diphosphate) 3'-pyrophosphohydrolase
MELSDEPGLTKAEQRAAQLAHAPTLSTRAKRIKVADKMDNVRSLRDDPPPWSTSLKLAYMESAEGVVRAIGGDYVEGTLVGAFFRTLLDVRKAVSAS